MPVVRLRAAVGFLTRVPVGRVEAADVARGAVAFPIVGAAVGAAAAGVALLVHPPLSPAVAAALAVAAGTVLTGALHLDALADTADAVGASTRERALEIMRDSRIGSFGAATLGLDLLLRVTVVAQLLGGSLLGPLIAAGALSRGASVELAAVLPYARVGEGVLNRRGSSLAGVVLAIVIAAVALRTDALVVIASVAVVTVVLGALYRRWLGGVTGDTLGATSELAELTALLVAAALG
jgi:adenosylcobinamide-GDP ribazoletransferase